MRANPGILFFTVLMSCLGSVSRCSNSRSAVANHSSENDAGSSSDSGDKDSGAGDDSGNNDSGGNDPGDNDSGGDDSDETPSAAAQSISTKLYQSVSVTLSGSDPEGATLTYSIVSSPSKGTITGTPPNITYAASSGYPGTDSFTFKVNNGTSDSSPATVTVTIATPRDYYFQPSVDYDTSVIDWNGLDNFNVFHWFLDSGFSVEAARGDPPTWRPGLCTGLGTYLSGLHDCPTGNHAFLF